MPSLAFAYSPWAAIGFIPIAVTASFTKNKNLREALSLQNMLLPTAMLVIYGTFYLTSRGGSGSRMALSRFTVTDADSFITYLLFIMLEFGMYFIIMWKIAAKYDFYYVVLAELLVLPLYQFISGDFIMRASIPALFILMTFVMRYFIEYPVCMKKKFLAAVMIIAAWTGMNEMNRSIGYIVLNAADKSGVLPAKFTHYLAKLHHEGLYSISEVDPDDTDNMNKYGQYISVPDYESSAFFRYLAAKSK